MSIKNTTIFEPEICDTVFVCFSLSGIRIWIINKILVEAETPDYTV